MNAKMQMEFELFADIFLQVWFKVHHGMNLLGAVAEQALQVADEPVDVTLSRRFQDYVLVVIVSEPPGQLLVVHLGLVLPDAPPPGHLVRVGHLELPAVPGPGDEVLAGLVGEQLQQELPQLDGTRAREGGAARGLGDQRGRQQRPGGGRVRAGGRGGVPLQEGWVVVHGEAARRVEAIGRRLHPAVLGVGGVGVVHVAGVRVGLTGRVRRAGLTSRAGAV